MKPRPYNAWVKAQLEQWMKMGWMFCEMLPSCGCAVWRSYRKAVSADFHDWSATLRAGLRCRVSVLFRKLWRDSFLPDRASTGFVSRYFKTSILLRSRQWIEFFKHHVNTLMCIVDRIIQACKRLTQSMSPPRTFPRLILWFRNISCIREERLNRILAFNRCKDEYSEYWLQWQLQVSTVDTVRWKRKERRIRKQRWDCWESDKEEKEADCESWDDGDHLRMNKRIAIP